ncbi:MAG: hypothetical protein HPY64_12310 [Anaerolineae bacterium]|nr:hypothetical protein [Anaerolineae bacterium]
MKKTISVILLSTLFVMAACTTAPPPAEQTAGTGATLAPVPARPAIQLSKGETVTNGLAGAYCWLQAANDIRCEPDPLNMQPEDALAVSQGDIVTFTIDSELGPPAHLYIRLLDDLDTGGAPTEIELPAPPPASLDYQVDLEPGTHRLALVAEYPILEGEIGFVSTIFALDVAGAVAAAPTQTAVIEPTELLTQPPTLEKPTATPEPSPTEPSEPTATTAVEVQPTATALPPTAEPATATPALLPTAAPQVAAPEVVIVRGRTILQPYSVSFCTIGQDGAQTCSDFSTAGQGAALEVTSGDTLRIDSAAGGPLSMTFTLLSSARNRELGRLQVPGNPIALYDVIAEPDSYILRVETEWPGATATYEFRLDVTG